MCNILTLENLHGQVYMDLDIKIKDGKFQVVLFVKRLLSFFKY